jgi:hypothetical protein
VVKAKNPLNKLLKVKHRGGIVIYLNRLEESNYFKLQAKSHDCNIVLEVESSKSELLNILKDFSEDLIYLDIHKIIDRKGRLFGLEEYIKVSSNTSRAWIYRILLLFLVVLFAIVFLSRISPSGVYANLTGVFLILILLLFFILLPCYTYLCLYWVDRAGSYNNISFLLNRLSNKMKFDSNYVDWNKYIDKICEIPKVFIKDAENILIYEVKKMERELDTSLEFVYVFAAISAIYIFSTTPKVGLINSTTLAFIGGVGFLTAIFSALYRYSSRRSKDFKVDCLEQLLLLLRLAQNKLESKDG